LNSINQCSNFEFWFEQKPFKIEQLFHQVWVLSQKGSLIKSRIILILNFTKVKKYKHGIYTMVQTQLGYPIWNIRTHSSDPQINLFLHKTYDLSYISSSFPSCYIRSTRFKHTCIIRFFCYFKKIRPKIRKVVQERRRKSGFKLKLGPNGRRLLSGAIAGAFSRTAVAPLETIRTHLMVGSHGHSLPEIFH
jgi:hypothetical protein